MGLHTPLQLWDYIQLIHCLIIYRSSMKIDSAYTPSPLSLPQPNPELSKKNIFWCGCLPHFLVPPPLPLRPWYYVQVLISINTYQSISIFSHLPDIFSLQCHVLFCNTIFHFRGTSDYKDQYVGTEYGADHGNQNGESDLLDERLLGIYTNTSLNSLQAYSLQCYLRQSWYDQRLKFDLDNITEVTLSNTFLKDIWKPNTYFLNGRLSTQPNITVPNVFVRIRKDGSIYMSRRYSPKSDKQHQFIPYAQGLAPARKNMILVPITKHRGLLLREKNMILIPITQVLGYFFSVIGTRTVLFSRGSMLQCHMYAVFAALCKECLVWFSTCTLYKEKQIQICQVNIPLYWTFAMNKLQVTVSSVIFSQAYIKCRMSVKSFELPHGRSCLSIAFGWMYGLRLIFTKLLVFDHKISSTAGHHQCVSVYRWVHDRRSYIPVASSQWSCGWHLRWRHFIAVRYSLYLDKE